MSCTQAVDYNGVAWPSQPSTTVYIPPTSAVIQLDSSGRIVHPAGFEHLVHEEPMDWLAQHTATTSDHGTTTIVHDGSVNFIYSQRPDPQPGHTIFTQAAGPQLPAYSSAVAMIGYADSIGHRATQWSPADPLTFMDPPVRVGHGPCGATEVHLDLHQWIIPHRVYAGGPPPEIPVAPVILGILVGDILDLGRLAQLKMIDTHRVAAFPDPEGHREKKKFTIRFAFEGLPVNEDPPQVQEYRKPEGSSKRVPLTRTDFAVVVVKQLYKFLPAAFVASATNSYCSEAAPSTSDISSSSKCAGLPEGASSPSS
ncbi:hypothetical protein VTO73DRAFT_4191 [Trametes versicolor]